MIKYKDRSGTVIVDQSKQNTILSKLYQSFLGTQTLKLLTRPAVSKLAGALLSTQASAMLIDGFVKRNQIDLEDYVPIHYHSYNEFFSRQIKHSMRPINYQKDVLISPCDAKVSAYPITEQSVFSIKGSSYSIASLTRSQKLSKEYAGGICVILRLTVDNYHRYCYVDTGKKSRNYHISGVYHTVNPVALKHVEVYKENSREFTLIKTQNFGTITQMEVGALFVGKIQNHLPESGYVHRGFEKGMFEFGGSTIVLLIQSGKAKIDEDICKNTREGYETLVKMGEQIGEKKNPEILTVCK